MSNGRGFRGRRQEKDWLALPSISVDLAADATSGLTALSPGTSVTVLRMIGEYVIGATSSAGIVAADNARIAVGIGVVSDDAFAAPALPDPAAEPGYPWLYWMEHSFYFAVAGAPSADQAGLSGAVRAAIDIRSMRKMKAGQSLAFVVQYVNVAGNPLLTVNQSRIRVLVGGQ